MVVWEISLVYMWSALDRNSLTCPTCWKSTCILWRTLILMLYGIESNLVDNAAEACCAQPILEDYTQSKLTWTHGSSVAEATHGYLNKAANLNVPRPSQDPTDLPIHINSTSTFKTPEYAPLSSIGTSGTNLRDHILNTESE